MDDRRVPTSAELLELAERLEACADELAVYGMDQSSYGPNSLNDEVWTAADQYVRAAAVRDRARVLLIKEMGIDRREQR